MADQPLQAERVNLIVFLAMVILLIAAVYMLEGALSPETPNAPRDDVSAAEYVELRERYEGEHAIWILGHTQAAFEWQHRSSRIIFWVSMLISLSGIAFAFWQFTSAALQDRLGREADELEIKTAMATLAFKTRSAAALILMVSIAYLLLYLFFVYPIDVVDTFTNTGSPVGASAEPSPVVQDFGLPDLPHASRDSDVK